MKVIKKTADGAIFERRDGRYAVRNADRQFLHGEDKLKMLAAAGLVEPAALREPKPAAGPAEDAPSVDGEGPQSEA